MIYIDLVFGFLKVGCLSFGGAYGAIPLIRDTVLSYGWMTDKELAYMIAVSESTPGPIMINLATYVGSSQAGFPGAVIATLAVVIPSFIIILLAAAAFNTVIKNRFVQAVLKGIKPCMTGIIMATGIYMTAKNVLFIEDAQVVEWKALLLTAILALLLFGSKRLFKRQISSVALIIVSAVLGIAIY